MRLCLCAHAIDWCENSKRFAPSRMHRKNGGWFTRLTRNATEALALHPISHILQYCEIPLRTSLRTSVAQIRIREVEIDDPSRATVKMTPD